MLETVTSALLSLVEIVRAIAAKIMIWMLGFFDSNWFMSSSLMAPGGTLLQKIVLITNDGDELLTIVLHKLVLPLAIILAAVLFSWALFKSILNGDERTAEAPSKIMRRAVISVILIPSVLTLYAYPAAFSIAVQESFFDVVSGYINEISDDDIDSFHSMLSDAFGVDADTNLILDGAKEILNNFLVYYVNYEARSSSTTSYRLPLSSDGDSYTGFTKPTENQLTKWVNLYGESYANSDDSAYIYTLEELEDALETYINNNTDDSEANILYVGMGLVSIAAMLIITVKYFGIVGKYVSKYVQTMMLIILAPLGAATYASESSEMVWKSYVRAYISTLIDLNLTFLFMNVIKYAAVSTFNQRTLAMFVLYYLMTMGLIYIVQSLPEILNRLGLSDPREREKTGAGLAMVLSSMGRTMYNKGSRPHHHGGGGDKGRLRNPGGGTAPAYSMPSGYKKALNFGANHTVNNMSAAFAAGGMGLSSLGGRNTVNTADRGMVRTAVNEARDMAETKVEGVNSKTGEVTSRMTRDGDKTVVTNTMGLGKDPGNMESVSKSLTALSTNRLNGGNGSAAKISAKGFNGHDYDIYSNREGKTVIRDQTLKQNITPDTDVESFDDAVKWLNTEGSEGGLVSGSVLTDKGAQFNVSAETDASGRFTGYTNSAGETEGFKAAVIEKVVYKGDEAGAGKYMKGDTFRVSNRAGSSVTTSTVEDAVTKRSELNMQGIRFTADNGRESVGVMDKDGKLTVWTDGQKQQYSSTEAFIDSRSHNRAGNGRIVQAEFMGTEGASYTNAEIERKKTAYFE